MYVSVLLDETFFFFSFFVTSTFLCFIKLIKIKEKPFLRTNKSCCDLETK